MAGPSRSFLLNWNFEGCQLCEEPTHTAISCPFMYSKCMNTGCVGIRMLLVSESNISKGQRYLKCQFPNCGEIQWLESAVKGYGTSTLKCSFCLAEDHASRECPWDGIPCCVNVCSGKRRLQTSKTEENPGKRYLSCDSCHLFEWLVDAIAKHDATMIQEQLLLKIPGSKGKGKVKNIENLCEDFASKSVLNVPRCYVCEGAEHMAKNCLWKSLPCKAASCNGTTKLSTSSRP